MPQRLLPIPLSLVATLGLLARSPSPSREHVEISGAVEVAPNVRLLLKSPVPLNAPNYWNAICLLPANQSRLVEVPKFGFLGVNGKEFSPSVAVVNSSGVEDVLPLVSDLGTVDGTWLCFNSSADQTLHPPFTSVAILSPEPISLKAVKWHSSDK